MLKVAVLLSCVIPVIAEGYMRVCYFSNWAQFRPVPTRMTPRKIDPKLCTHLIYAFAKLDSNSELNFTEWNDGEMVTEFTGLKKENPYLKTLLAVGGYNQGSKPFSDMTANKNLRNKFVRTAVAFLKQWNFDGLDLDWEYPAGKGGRKGADKRNYVNLLRELRKEIDLGSRKLSLSIAVPSGKDDLDIGFDITQIAKYVDFINLMSYDIHGDWEKKAGHNSPLFPRRSETGVDRQLNVDWAAKYLLEQGAPKEKLIIGLPTYGRHYKLSKKSNNGIGAPIRRAGKKGPYTKEDGFLAYYEVCELLESGQMKWDDEQQVPYLLHKDHWIGYENGDSFSIKLEYVKEYGYGGASVWNIDLDDFDKLCPDSTRAFPLISLMAEVLGEYKSDDISEYTLASNDEPEEAWNEESGSSGSEFKRVCFFTNWAMDRKWPAKFKVSDIDPCLCTHLIYAFAKLENYQLVMYNTEDIEMYKEFNKLKTINPDLKTLIAIGGWRAGSVDFSRLVANDARRQSFAKEVVPFLEEYGFDGLNLHWQYPAKRGGTRADKENFIKWMKDIRGEFDSSGKDFLLTAAVSAGQWVISKAYDIPEMAKYLDFVNLMSFDLHGGWDGYVGHNSPLYKRADETEGQATLNVDWAAKYWVSKGLPKSKLMIGLPTYGRSFTLENINNNDFGDKAAGHGPASEYTREKGMLAYYEVCTKIENGQRKWHNEHKVPYLINGLEWIGYDDEESITLKAKYIKEGGYGGAMVWTMDLDDFDKQCPSSSERYPLLNIINRELDDNPSSRSVASGDSTGLSGNSTDWSGDREGWSGRSADTPDDTGYTYSEANTSGAVAGPSVNENQAEAKQPQQQILPKDTFEPKAINRSYTASAFESILSRLLGKLTKQHTKSSQRLDTPVDSVDLQTESQETDLLHQDSLRNPEANMEPPHFQDRGLSSEDSDMSHLDSARSNLPYLTEMQDVDDRDTHWLETFDSDIEDDDFDEDYIF